ncbi:MAG: histidine phosphatase family protein [Candidatus Gracilibacteria bacterium]
MNNTFYFIRHGKTQVDNTKPISEWVLSSKGEEQSQNLLNESRFYDTDIIIASGETKSYQTIKPLADKLNKEIICYDEISELDRDTGGFMQFDEYENAVKECLMNLDTPYQTPQGKWESASHALERFSRKIKEIDTQYEGKNIIVCGHGFTINLYFSQLLGQLDQVYERTQKNDFCDWGIIKNYTVIKDVVR